MSTLPAGLQGTRPATYQQAEPVIAAIGSGKGGTGKTTVTMGLAATSALLGFRTLIVDADRQRSAYRLWRRMRNKPPYECVAEDNLRELYRLRGTNRFEVILVDTPGSLAEGGVLDQLTNGGPRRQSLDLIVIPTDMDALSTPPTVDTVEFVAARGVKLRTLLNRLTPGERTAREKDAREYFTAYRSAVMPAGVPVFDAWVRKYVAHANAIQYGIPITWYRGPGDEQARMDLMAVFVELLARERPGLTAAAVAVPS
jgi:cellulose biosynthesis protein BcsQ